MKRTISYFHILFIIGFMITSCATKVNDKPIVKNSIEKFDDFYKQFLSDENFQVERVKFPLKGKYMNNDIAGSEISEDKIWTKENWDIIHDIKPEYLKQFKVKKTFSGEKVIIRIEGIETNILFEETFEILNGKWFLIYLTDISM